MWEEEFKSMPDGSKAQLVKIFRYSLTGPRLVRFEARIDIAYAFQSSATTSLFDGFKWNEIDYLIGQDIKDGYDNSIDKIFAALQKRAETILTYEHS